MTKALLVWGGWDGHTPKDTTEIFAEELKKRDVEVTVQDSLECYEDCENLKTYDVIIPYWTMGKLTKEQWKGLNEAVKSGVGFAGVHGGTGDAFRGNIDYEWMVGGIFVGHPHVDDYTVCLTTVKDPITDGLPHSFPYKSEQYYMLTDPGNRVLMDTLYEREGMRVRMPVTWTKSWGEGRVFYSALGHVAQEFKDYPQVLEMTMRGFLWAAEGKK
jgi:type 1 glutamine amidotransferase